MEEIKEETIVKPNNTLVGFEQAKEVIQNLSARCATLIITDDDNLFVGKKLAKEGAEAKKLIENKRTELNTPILKRKSEIDNIAKELQTILERGVTPLRDQILAYEQRKERQRLAELARIEEEKRKAEEALKAASVKNEPIAEKKIQELAELQQKAVATATPAPSSIHKVWTYEIVDQNIIPRNYLEVNTVAINGAIKAGVREIPGIRIFQKDQLTIR